jgi:integrase
MASTRFFVRSSTDKKSKPVNIRVRLKDGDSEAYAKTHLSLQQKYWNQSGKNLRAKIRDAGDFKERDWFKDQLEHLDNHIRTSYQNKGEVTNQWLTECIERFRNPAKFEEKPVTLFEYIEQFIKQSETAKNRKTGQPVSYRIRKDYERTFSLIKEFSKGRDIDFKDIDLTFYSDFVSFLESKDYKANTVGKFIKNLKTFLNKATAEDINTNLKFKLRDFVKIQVDTETVYLNSKELSIIQELDLSNKPHLERVRDLFLVGSWTGLRYGDVKRLKPENIKDGFISIKQEKTGDWVVIPLHSVVVSILDKYDGRLPEAISNQKTNGYLKEIAQLAELNEPIHITEMKGGVTKSIKKLKHQLISTHTARRSFATNLYKSGFPSQSIMKITGHRSELSFLKYLKVTPEEHAKLLQKHWLDSGNHLKVV